MKTKIILLIFAVASAFLLLSCKPLISPLVSKEMPTLYPIIQRGGISRGKFGYINIKGEVVIQPQFSEAMFFSESLASVCIEGSGCGYIDESGKLAVNPQFEFAGRFSEGLAAVVVGDKLGYVDKTGKFVINPQFQTGDMRVWFSIFSDGLAGVKIGDKYGFVDKEGKIVINPQFDVGLPFMEGLAAVRMGEKWGFVDKEGKIVINPQFEEVQPFVNGLAAARIGEQWGYIDKTGKITINPQFDFAVPFANEGIALVFLKDKAGYIDKQGKYIVNPQFSVYPVDHDLVPLALSITSDLGKLSFSEGLALANIGGDSRNNANFGYIDNTGKIVINPQFKLAFPFYGDLALVMFDREEFGWIDKEGKIVWRETKETQQTNTNVNRMNSNVMMNTNKMMDNKMMDDKMSDDKMNADKMSNLSSTSPSNQKTGHLVTDSNLRSEPNKDSVSVGIHFKDAKVTILDETSYERDGTVSTWYKIRVTDYGCSKDTSLGCGKNSPNDSDEGWVNAKGVLLN